MSSWVGDTRLGVVAEGGAVAAYAMRQLHRGNTDFELLVPFDLLQQKLRAQRTFGLVLGSVAGLALLIGGIGIMNTMLASVLERTSKIGLRQSVAPPGGRSGCSFWSRAH